jgi:predicted enzyme related to lactoylglutathione lyase
MQTNPVVWFEIYVQDMARAKAFYQTLLQRTLEKLNTPDSLEDGMEMWAFPMDMSAPGASGALAKMDGCGSGGGGTLVYFSCEDCAVEAARAAPAHQHRGIRLPDRACGQGCRCDGPRLGGAASGHPGSRFLLPFSGRPRRLHVASSRKPGVKQTLDYPT